MCGVFLSTVRSFPSWDRSAACAGPSPKRAFPRAAGSADSAPCCPSRLAVQGGDREALNAAPMCTSARSPGRRSAQRTIRPLPREGPRGDSRCGAGAEIQGEARFSGSGPRRGLVLRADRGPGRGHPPEPREPSGPGSVFCKGGVAQGSHPASLRGQWWRGSLGFSHMRRKSTVPPIVRTRTRDSLPVAV